jgi:acetyl-CoA carboxylase biotin carboxylase subunit
VSDFPIESVLVANRAEIARRIVRSARALGVRSVVVHSSVDGTLPFALEADDAVELPGAPAQAYLDVDAVLDAAQRSGAQAIHPGYGFLAENAEFAQQVLDAGLIWVGPAPAAIDAMGDKINARNLMAAAGVPVAAGSSDPIADEDAAVAEAHLVGYPVMVKAAAGGGGIGMGVARDDAELRSAFATARARAERFFASAAIFVERYIENARHVEIQVLGLVDGDVVALGERDCSVQRRHQKLVEETPSPGITTELRARMVEAAVRAAKAVDYRNAGTVECLVDADAQDFVFLEMNTRLQVEHPVTELVTGIDLVEQQLRVAAGLDVSEDVRAAVPRGHAIEFRVYAEDPVRFLPSPGVITAWAEPQLPGVRVDAGYAGGTTVTPFYDPLLAKLCVHGHTREEAIELARRAVKEFRVDGPRTNLAFFDLLLRDEAFVSGAYDTKVIEHIDRTVLKR